MNKGKQDKLKLLASAIISIALFAAPFSGIADNSATSSASASPVSSTPSSRLSDEQQQAQQLEDRLDQLDQQIFDLQNQLNSRQKQEASLKNELALYTDQEQQVQLEIQAVQTKIEDADLQINIINTEIQQDNIQIFEQRQNLSGLIVNMAEQDDESGIQLDLGSGTFSDFLNQLEYNRSVQTQISNIISKIDSIKSKVQSSQTLLQAELNQFGQDTQQLTTTEQILSAEKNSEELLLVQTKGKEMEYQQILTSSETQETDLAQEVFKLDKQAGITVGNDKLPIMHGVLSWPLQGVITQGYGNTGFTALGYDFHNGLDIAAAAGSPIVAAADGVVIDVGTGEAEYGNWVAIKHTIAAANGHQIVTLYAHLMSITATVGGNVKQGQLIGFEGNTGNTTRLLYGPEHGYHLHFSVFDAVGFKVTPGAYQKEYGPYEIPSGYTYDPDNFF